MPSFFKPVFQDWLSWVAASAGPAPGTVDARSYGEGLNGRNFFPVPDFDTGINLAGTIRDVIVGWETLDPAAIRSVRGGSSAIFVRPLVHVFRPLDEAPTEVSIAEGFAELVAWNWTQEFQMRLGFRAELGLPAFEAAEEAFTARAEGSPWEEVLAVFKTRAEAVLLGTHAVNVVPNTQAGFDDPGTESILTFALITIAHAERVGL